MRLGAMAQHHRVVIDGGGEVYCVLLLGDERQAQDLGVVLGLLVEIWRFVRRVGDLVDADHSDFLYRLHLFPVGDGFS